MGEREREREKSERMGTRQTLNRRLEKGKKAIEGK